MQAFSEKDQEKKGKKKTDSAKKRPSPPYALWCKDQWNEVTKGKKELLCLANGLFDSS